MQNINYAFLLSRPVWGAWIEILLTADLSAIVCTSRPVWGAWIEIIHRRPEGDKAPGRAPYGARGLKFAVKQEHIRRLAVAPRMGRVD